MLDSISLLKSQYSIKMTRFMTIYNWIVYIQPSIYIFQLHFIANILKHFHSKTISIPVMISKMILSKPSISLSPYRIRLFPLICINIHKSHYIKLLTFLLFLSLLFLLFFRFILNFFSKNHKKRRFHIILSIYIIAFKNNGN